MYMNSPLFSPKCFQFVDASLMKHLQYFDIPIHLPTLRLAIRTITVKLVSANSNYNVFTQIIDNLLGRNIMRGTWKLLQNGDWITHTDYFDGVEQMQISLLKTHEYVIIYIQAVRVESHKYSLQIVRKYSKK